MTGSSDSPLVSVVVPTYERPELLADAVDSVANQTYDDVELLVVDDGSATPAATTLADREFDDATELRVLRHDENRGANVARNRGVAAASGEFVAFLDDDDYWHPEKLQRQMEAFQRADDDVGVVFNGQKCVDESGRVTNVTRPATSGRFTENLVKGETFGPFSCVMVRTEVFERAGYPDERLPCWQDREWYLRLARHYDYASITDLLTVGRFTTIQQISDRFESRRDVTRPLLLEKHRQRFADRGRQYERWFLGWLAYGMATSAMDNGHHREAVGYLLRLVRYAPTAASTYVSVVRLLVTLGGRYTSGPARACKQFCNRVAARSSDPVEVRSE